jgi:hypothetical protein
VVSRRGQPRAQTRKGQLFLDPIPLASRSPVPPVTPPRVPFNVLIRLFPLRYTSSRARAGSTRVPHFASATMMRLQTRPCSSRAPNPTTTTSSCRLPSARLMSINDNKVHLRPPPFLFWASHSPLRVDTLIVWTEPNGIDYALSFQDPEGCAEVWNFILEVQRMHTVGAWHYVSLRALV